MLHLGQKLMADGWLRTLIMLVDFHMRKPIKDKIN